MFIRNAGNFSEEESQPMYIIERGHRSVCFGGCARAHGTNRRVPDIEEA